MSNLTKMDLDAGYAAVSAMESHTEFLGSMMSALDTQMGACIDAWHGTSKTQFENTWSEYASAVTSIKQSLQDIRDNLRFEVQSVEEVFQA